MPELPEVEAYTRYFAKHALNQSITRVDVRDHRILGTRTDRFVRALRGTSFERVHRHGKHLFADAGKVWLHLHFGMSGDLSAWKGEAEPPRFARVIFSFENGKHLAFEDMRLFGVAELVDDPDAYIAEHQLGPDPLDRAFRLPGFRTILAGRRGAIKALLMTQQMIAGVGNLYADEALFQSGIHPRRAVDELSDSDVRMLLSKLQRILRDAVKRRVGGDDDEPRWLVMTREEDARCRLCGGAIQRTVVFGRTTYFCVGHQK